MDLTRRTLLGSTAATLLAAPRQVTAQSGAITPEQFGATGDGRTNDTAAFAAMAAFVNRQGGGEIALRKTTYIVGGHGPGGQGGNRWAPASILDFVSCSRPLVIRGNGARLRCAAGLRFGTFDADGRRTRHATPHYGLLGEISTPYVAMISAKLCTGPVDISDIELDGNIDSLNIGGPWGDTGWQIPCTGINLIDNAGSERVARVHSHHHGLDGIMINGSPERAGAGLVEDVVCEYNGRQGCSLVGGRNYRFVRSRFNHTGKAALMSAPGGGVDIEAEGRTIRDVHFVECEFSNNSGPGLVADSGDSEGARFDRCRFIGTTSWAAWPKKPRFRFNGCEFVGPIVHAFGDPDPDRAAQFHDCLFRDDPALSPTGVVYSAGGSSTIADLPGNRNVLFNRCRFLVTHRLVLPWTTNVTIFSECLMTQASAQRSYPRGTFIGRNRIDGNVDLYSARIAGELIVNGKVMARTH